MDVVPDVSPNVEDEAEALNEEQQRLLPVADEDSDSISEPPPLDEGLIVQPQNAGDDVLPAHVKYAF